MNRTFYAKAMLNKRSDPTRWESGQPYNFTILGFSSKALRDECCDHIWQEGGNLIFTKRKALEPRDLPCPVIDDLKVFKCALRYNFDYETLRSEFVNTENPSGALQRAVKVFDLSQ